MRIMNMLAMLYPLVIKITGEFKYTIQKNMPGFNAIIEGYRK